jgi:hypothetical protein
MDYDPSTGRLIWKKRKLAGMLANIMFNKRFARKPAGYISSTTGYRMITVEYEEFTEHQLVWFYHHGTWPIEIDHENGKRSGNKIEDIRNVSHQENNKNKKINRRNESGVNGVRWDKSRGKWIVQIGVNGKTKTIGRYDNINDAIKARKEADKLYGFHPNHGRKS